MNQLTIIVATRNRQTKLEAMLKTVPVRAWLEVWVVCDGDRATYTWLQSDPYSCVTRVELLTQNRGAVYARNWLAGDVDDGLLYATDDIVFLNGSVEGAFERFAAWFPDDDGVVGFRQLKDHHPTGVAMMGQRFLRRYPKKQLFCPQYFHFACQEVLWLADKLGRFHYDEDAVVDHYHPSFNPLYMDQTHIDARIHKREDQALMRERKAAGKIWGMNG